MAERNIEQDRKEIGILRSECKDDRRNAEWYVEEDRKEKADIEK